MGTPLPPNEVGESCPNCFGPGKIWDGQPTPKFVKMRFFGWSPGAGYQPELEQLLLSHHILQQTFGPCEYFIKIGDLDVDFFLGEFASSAFIFSDPYLTPYFYGFSNHPCELVIASELIESDGTGAFGGFMSIEWNPRDLL